MPVLAAGITIGGSLLGKLLFGGGPKVPESLQRQGNLQADSLQRFLSLIDDLLNEARTQRGDDKAARANIADFDLGQLFSGTDLGQRVFGEGDNIGNLVNDARFAHRDSFINQADRQFLQDLMGITGMAGQVGSGGAPSNLSNQQFLRDQMTAGAFSDFAGGLGDILGLILGGNQTGQTPGVGGTSGSFGGFGDEDFLTNALVEQLMQGIKLGGSN